MRRNKSPAVGQHFEEKKEKHKNSNLRGEDQILCNVFFTKSSDVLNSHQAFSFAV